MKKMITVYTTPTCGTCNALKAYLKKENIEYKEVDVLVDQDSLSKIMAKAGKMELPIIEKGDKVIVGFHLNELQDLINN